MKLHAANQVLYAERRDCERIQAADGTIVAFTPRWPCSSVFGHILDMSASGLAVRYEGDKAPPGESFGLSMVYPKGNLGLPGLSVKTVWDREIKDGFGTRMCGVEFVKVHNEQKTDLEYFIRKTAIE